MDRLSQDERFCETKLFEFTVAAKAELPFKYFQKLSTEDLARFIVAREGNVAAALKQLTGALEWQQEHQVGNDQEQRCELCVQDPTSHSHIPIGILLDDPDPSTIFYGCPARGTHSAVDPIVHHVGRQLEYCFRLPTTGSRWIWCVDYNGFGLKEAMQAKLGAKFVSLFSNHMPERLHKIILLNPPSIFRLLLQAIRPFADQRTLDKLIPVTGSTTEVISVLRMEHNFPPTALDWLEKTLDQRLPTTLPPLPSETRDLLLPSLVSVMNFAQPRKNNNNNNNNALANGTEKKRDSCCSTDAAK